MAVKTSPALSAYLERIGAEVLSFRRAMVKEYVKGDQYYVERTLIKVGADGKVDCSRKEHEPTREEAAQIAAEVIKLDLPQSVGATRANFNRFLSTQKGDASRFFTLWDRKGGSIRMVQERIVKPDRTKIFVPWTMWSDGEWRRMEPDGALPMWKPEQRSRVRVMIHEGCKAARFMTELMEDPERLERHPWKDVIVQYEHWGMIGGALAPHRTDYDEIRRERPVEVVYVCDNDYAGESALQQVSKSYGQSLKGIRFGKHFPTSWDMADDFPPNLFTSKGRYVGPELKELIKPATRATELVYPDGKGRPSAVLKRAFKEEWVHAVTPEVFIHREWPSKIYTAPEFNNFVAPYSDVDDTARLVKKDDASKTAILKYDPGKPPGIYGDGGSYINTYTPSIVKAEQGDAAPWTDFMRKLIPSEGDRQELMRWCATLIARPDIKMSYGVLVISETQGVGKGTLGERILAPLVGDHNTSRPSESEVVDSNYNYWMAHKRLAIIHEIYSGHSSKAYNKLKSIVTDPRISVSKKYQANYDIDNWVHIFACSNSMRALHLSHEDRRWFVPRATELKQSPSYWMDFNEWLVERGGLGIIRWWAQEWLKSNAPVLRGQDAPWSDTKKTIIEEGYSPGMTLVSDFLDKVLEKAEEEAWVEQHGKPEGADGGWKNQGVAVVDTELVDMIRYHIYEGRRTDRLEKPLTVRKIAKAKRWFVNPQQVFYKGAHKSRIICSRRTLSELPAKELLNRVRPLPVRELAKEWFGF